MSSQDHPLSGMIRKLEGRAALDEGDRDAILALPYVKRVHESPSYIVREGEPPKRHCSFILSGLAFRQKLAASGARQIVSIHMAGDFLDLQHLFLNRADHSVQALNRLQAAEIDRAALQDLLLQRPAVAKAMWIDALVDASIFREWILNVGRRNAKARVAHLLCEVSLRMEAAGLANGNGYDLPLTQEQLGDAVGLTSVHVNRTLKVLAHEGLVRRNKRHIQFDNVARLREVADFSALYLHLDQAGAPQPAQQ
jgi:CRP-like cAMP-binding protein